MTALLFSPFFLPPAVSQVFSPLFFVLAGIFSLALSVERPSSVEPALRKVKLDSVTFPLPQQFDGDRISGVPLKEPFEYRDGLVRVTDAEMDLGQGQVSGLIRRQPRQ
jgi:hypothetical protein